MSNDCSPACHRIYIGKVAGPEVVKPKEYENKIVVAVSAELNVVADKTYVKTKLVDGIHVLGEFPYSFELTPGTNVIVEDGQILAAF